MKITSFQTLLCLLLAFITQASLAQNQFTIRGRVTDSQSKPIPSATVFINATTRITATDEHGRFSISSVAPGNYELSISMLGYDTHLETVQLQDENAETHIILKQKTIQLNEVRIGPDRFKENFEKFKKTFLGTSAAAKKCVIVNPQVIEFSSRGKKLLASTNEFIIIENRHLGYKLRYLLTSFEHDAGMGVALYNGQVVFEKLPGSDQEVKQWEKNRSVSYQGSMMHFLRSVFSNTVAQEGFTAQQFHNNVIKHSMDLVAIEQSPMLFDTLVTPVDASFKSFRFPNLYLKHSAKKAKITKPLHGRKVIPFAKKASFIRLVADEALIDGRGSYPNPKTFYIYGYLAQKRVADMLPYEYLPGK
ncbi:carboxypeptidase-like regulatory domain-containing protein [Pedobacter faecalis]|uniref:carboxypeptidase-like regulatory domain-containing protein n=1 Tax=Pedobacter faecalis TaxID=3041495 RepID=UPI00254D81E5|nr:carboxypeptidase-like regulatory domain-containing protein [Pedobacter sp. ELA7]